MSPSNTLTLVDPANGNLAFKIFSFEGAGFFDHIQRNNYYSLIWVRQGGGRLKADFSSYPFSDNYLFSFSPYQPFMIEPETANINGDCIQFHPDFFCIHKHQQEIACNGVLFNNIYQPPFVRPDSDAVAGFDMLLAEMRKAMQQPALAQYELLLSYLKIFLITASRLKAAEQPALSESLGKLKQPFILQSLKEAIESNFKTRHTASDYAGILNISAKALAKITRTYLDKTLTSLISERIIIEAKRELYLTNKPVKQIAYELGYDDEYYFSRFFKTNTDVSPQLYRDTVGFGRQAAEG